MDESDWPFFQFLVILQAKKNIFFGNSTKIGRFWKFPWWEICSIFKFFAQEIWTFPGLLHSSFLVNQRNSDPKSKKFWGFYVFIRWKSKELRPFPLKSFDTSNWLCSSKKWSSLSRLESNSSEKKCRPRKKRLKKFLTTLFWISLFVMGFTPKVIVFPRCDRFYVLEKRLPRFKWVI